MLIVSSSLCDGRNVDVATMRRGSDFGVSKELPKGVGGGECDLGVIGGEGAEMAGRAVFGGGVADDSLIYVSRWYAGAGARGIRSRLDLEPEVRSEVDWLASIMTAGVSSSANGSAIGLIWGCQPTDVRSAGGTKTTLCGF